MIQPVSTFHKYYSDHRYRLLDTCFRIRCSSTEIERLTHPIVAHLEAPSETLFDITLDVIEDGNRYHLLANSILVASCSEPAELGPIVHANISLSAYESVTCLIGIHAAAVRNGNECILLPGASGNGKTTLTAALMCSRFPYLTDELALLMHGSHQIRSAPVSLCLKRGAWSVLAPFHPVINNLPIHWRDDGNAVRYLAPPAVDLATGVKQSYPVRRMIFPLYQPGGRTTFVPLTSAEALHRLTEAGYDVKGRLRADCIGQLVNWIAKLDCYELKFNFLHEAVSRLENCCSE